jgi:hypothetical protein
VFETSVGWLVGYKSDAVRMQQTSWMASYNASNLYGTAGRPALPKQFRSVVGTDVDSAIWDGDSYEAPGGSLTGNRWPSKRTGLSTVSYSPAFAIIGRAGSLRNTSSTPCTSEHGIAAARQRAIHSAAVRVRKISSSSAIRTSRFSTR